MLYVMDRVHSCTKYCNKQPGRGLVNLYPAVKAIPTEPVSYMYIFTVLLGLVCTVRCMHIMHGYCVGVLWGFACFRTTEKGWLRASSVVRWAAGGAKAMFVAAADHRMLPVPP